MRNESAEQNRHRLSVRAPKRRRTRSGEANERCKNARVNARAADQGDSILKAVRRRDLLNGPEELGTRELSTPTLAMGLSGSTGTSLLPPDPSQLPHLPCRRATLNKFVSQECKHAAREEDGSTVSIPIDAAVFAGGWRLGVRFQRSG